MSASIESLKNNAHSNDILHDIYGISSNEHFDAIFVAPSWPIDRVFDMPANNIELVYEDRFSKSHRITNGNKTYLYVQLQIGASNIIDFCLSCYQLACDNFVFIGSVGALVPEINVGDVFIPTSAISGNGASVYMHDKLDASNLFEKTYSNPELNNILRTICTDMGIKTGDALPISMDSVACEYLHLDEFRDMGAQLIDMEVATFFKSIAEINKCASAILVVSDNSAAGQHLIGMDTDVRTKYHAVRAKFKDILLRI